TSALSCKASTKPDISRATASQSNTARRRVNTTDCQRWRPNWCAAKWPQSLRPAAPRRHPQPRLRPRHSHHLREWQRPGQTAAPCPPQRPGGNVTGLSFESNALGAKRLELLKELVPSTVAIGFLVNPNNPNADSETTDVLLPCAHSHQPAAGGW